MKVPPGLSPASIHEKGELVCLLALATPKSSLNPEPSEEPRSHARYSSREEYMWLTTRRREGKRTEREVSTPAAFL